MSAIASEKSEIAWSRQLQGASSCLLTNRTGARTSSRAVTPPVRENGATFESLVAYSGAEQGPEYCL
jgi:hypothetical protein